MSDINLNGTQAMQAQTISKNIPSEENTHIQESDNLFPNNEKNNVNGVLEEFNQGENNDCGLVSTLVSFKNSEKGREFIKQAISKTENGYSVYFKGAGKSYEITQEELEAALKSGYSTGNKKGESADADAVLLELAFEKACDEAPSSLMNFKHKVNNIFSFLHISDDKYSNKKSIEAESPYYFMELLTGKKSKMITNFLGNFSGSSRILNKLHDKDFLACASFYAEEGETQYIKDINGNEIEAVSSGGHVWSIKSIDEDYVTLINPWDSNNEVKVKKEELKKAQRIEYCILD